MDKRGFIIIISIVGIAIIIVLYKIFSLKKGKSLPTSDKVDCTKSFLFIGDSLTASDQSYANQLSSVCPGINIKKIAVVGKQTDWMLDQLTSELANNKYDVISIWGGVNDIYARNSISGAESNLQQMYDMAKSSGAKVVALTVIPTRTYNISTDKTVSLTNELNKWILSNSTPDAIVNVNSLVNDGNDGTKAEYLLPDTLHLNASGQNVVMNDFAKKVINA